MKKLTAAIAALALFFSASAFGPEPTNEENALLKASDAKVITSEKVGKLVISAFKEKFENASAVTWKENQGLYFGYFKQHDQDITVAFTEDGELFATIRKTQLSDLPTDVQQTLKEKYNDCAIATSAAEIDMQGETCYYVTVENKTSTRLVKFFANGQNEVLKKTKKKVLVGSVS